MTLPASGHSLATLLLNLLTANQDRYLCPSGSPTSTTSLLLASGGVC
ncbi:MAG: hypothetical protein ACRENY_01550 [Candidatus Dormibacteria bacterium]